MATAALLRSGDVIGGFRIDDVIGIGGMAIVYRAEQISLGRAVALKVLTSKLSRDEVFRERFRREGTHAAGLEHPNIVPIYDYGEQDGNLYIAMRLVEGTNLAELIQTRGLTADQTIEILSPIASALDSAHAAGLIHRDIKPQNVLITAHGHPYLADFGVAKGSNTEGLTATGGFVGSIHYASPEQIKGLTLTPASDIYALTAVLYQCLTGRVPFPRETDAGVMHAHLHDPPPTLPSASGADSDFHTVLARGMAKDPGARYGHAGDLINAAGLCVSRLPIELRKTVPAFPESPDSTTPIEPAIDSPLVSDTEIVDIDDLAPHTSSDQSQQARQSVSGGPGDRSARRPATAAAAGPTTADRRRAPAAPPTPARESKRSSRRILAGVTAAGACVLALAAVLLITSGNNGAAASSTIRSGPLELRFSHPWHRVAASAEPLPGLGFSSALALSGAAVTVNGGAVRHSSPLPGAVPPGLTRRLGPPSRTATVTLGHTTARRYEWSGSTSTEPLALFVIATDTGDLALACQPASTTALAACTELVGSARVVGVNLLTPGPQPALASGIAAALAPNTRARQARAGLTSSRFSDRAATARRIAAADTATAAALARLSVPQRASAAMHTASGSLQREAVALTALARAAERHSRRRYASARAAAAAAGRSLTAALAGLRAMGYAASLPALPLPDLPQPVRPRTARTQPTAGAVSAPQPTVTSSATSTPEVTPSAPTTSTTRAAPTPATHTAPKKSEYGPTVVAGPTGQQ